MRVGLAALCAALTLVVAACGDGMGGGEGGQTITGRGDSLAGVCPHTVVIQSDWEPEAEYGALYQLLGRGSFHGDVT